MHHKELKGRHGFFFQKPFCQNIKNWQKASERDIIMDSLREPTSTMDANIGLTLLHYFWMDWN